MSLHLPPKSFRDSYVWRGGSLDGAAASRPSRSRSGLPFGRDGRVHPTSRLLKSASGWNSIPR